MNSADDSVTPPGDTHHLREGDPDVDELVLRPATEIAAMLRRGEVSSREATQALLERIETVDPAVHAVVELRAEQALAEAADADRALTQGGTGPLHGVPMTIKDSFNVRGLHTTWGNPTFAEHVAGWDATVVRRLRRAGAIIVGKTNVAFMLGDFGQTANDLYGVTNNPWDTARTPGGSTGGGAAALTAGMTFLEYGSDLVGSIRIPASFCGVYGLKPSVGIVPLTGFQPPGPPAAPSDMRYLSAVGPLGRSVGDLRTALNVTAGPEAPAANAYSWQLSPARHAQLRDFRVGVVFDHDRAPVSSEVTAVLSEAVETLARAGATIVEGWPDDVDPVADAAAFGFHVQMFFAFEQPGDDLPDLAELIRHEHRRMAARAAWGRHFDNVDVFVCPTNFTPAFPHDDRPFDQRTISTPEGARPYDNQPFWVSHASLAGLPAAAVPIGRTRGGLPVGAQIIGPLFEDGTALEFAELLGDVTEGYVPPPV